MKPQEKAQKLVIDHLNLASRMLPDLDNETLLHYCYESALITVNEIIAEHHILDPNDNIRLNYWLDVRVELVNKVIEE